MKYPTLSDRLNSISIILQRGSDLREYLELERNILRVYLEAISIYNGTWLQWIDKLSLHILEQKSLKTKKPIVSFLDPDIFDIDLLISIFQKVAKLLIERYPQNKGLKKIQDTILNNTLDLLLLIDSILKGNEKLIQNYAEKFGIEPTLLFFLINTPIKPFIEAISQSVSPTFFDRWWRGNCPICGQLPRVAWIRDRRRYLVCTFCGAEYLSDYFLCVNCNNKDPHTLKFINIKSKPEFQLDFCTKCKNYVKVIIESKLKQSIPKSLEDILTLNLDVEAKGLGLIRH